MQIANGGARAALGPSLVPLLSPFGIDPESGSEAQPRLIRFAKIPDYFSEFKQRSGELGVYLGGCIVAKVRSPAPCLCSAGSIADPDLDLQILVSDVQSKLFVVRAFLVVLDRVERLTLGRTQSKADYTSKGPATYRLLEMV